MLHYKKAELEPEESDRQVRSAVEAMLDDIAKRGEAAVRDLARKFDRWEGEFVLSAEKKKSLIDSVPASVKNDIRFAYEQVYRFAEAQRDSLVGPGNAYVAYESRSRIQLLTQTY